tara:strand:+ start:2483 stop:2857 length:375 start_codon:yes stop_codon:yes gene_type:complete
MSEETLSEELIELLGQETFIAFVGAFAGVRLYIPVRERRQEIDNAIGPEASERLHHTYEGGYIRVPLARDLRARHYRAAGASNAEIARLLGITESGVDKLFRRVGHPRRPRRQTTDPRQTDLFR